MKGRTLKVLAAARGLALSVAASALAAVVRRDSGRRPPARHAAAPT